MRITVWIFSGTRLPLLANCDQKSPARKAWHFWVSLKLRAKNVSKSVQITDSMSFHKYLQLPEVAVHAFLILIQTFQTCRTKSRLSSFKHRPWVLCHSCWLLLGRQYGKHASRHPLASHPLKQSSISIKKPSPFTTAKKSQGLKASHMHDFHAELCLAHSS